MIDENKLIDDLNKKAKEFDNECGRLLNKLEFQEAYRYAGKTLGIVAAMEIVKEQEKIEVPFARVANKWIPVSEMLPENEEEVEITYTRKDYQTGEKHYYTARAFYEDGTVRTEDSAYCWNIIDDWEYDEVRDCYIIPEGWYGTTCFSEEFSDMPVIAWRSLPKPYKPKGDE